MLEDLGIQVSRGFGIKPKSIKKIKSCYICDTYQGFKIINKTKDSKESIVFQNKIKDHLILNGFCNIDRFYLAQDNNPYYIFDGNIYIMTDIFDYEKIDFLNKDEFLKLIKVISRFHLCLSSMDIESNSMFYGEDIKVNYINSFNEFLHIKKFISSKKRLTNFDVVFLKNYDYYLKGIKDAIDYIEDTKYELLKNNSKIKNSISHNLLRKENIFVNRNDIYITNFSDAKIDINLVDLSILIRRYIKYVGKDAIPIDKIIEIYSNNKELNKDEIKILYSMLVYPEKFVKICMEYYAKKRTWDPSSLLNRVEDLINRQSIYYDYLKGINIIC